MENTQVGPFLILEKLGTTRRQKVYRALQVQQNREFALKFLTIPPKFDRKLALEKLTHEFQILKTLRHPNLVRSFGAGVEGNQIFWATELIPGESLTSLLSRRGRIASDQVTDYARQIAFCLEYLHAQRFIHSKLTPDKLLISRDDTVHIADLRLNRSKKRRWDSVKHSDAELAAYLAPEQLTGYATHKSDIYALGTIMYEMLTGHLPFPPDNIARMTRRKLEDSVESVATQVLSCPIWLDRLVMQMIHPIPRRRPHSAQAVRLALEEIARIDATSRSAIDELSGGFNPLHVNLDKTEARALLRKTTRVQKQPRKNWAEIGGLAVALIILVSFLTYFLWPESTETLVQRAAEKIESSAPEDWAAARKILSRVEERSLSGMMAEQVHELFVTSRRKTLVDQARRGVQNGLQSPAAQAFVGAFQLEQAKNFGEAFQAYQSILDQNLDAQGEDEFVLLEAQFRSQRIEPLKDIPTGTEEFAQWLESSREIQEPEELELIADQLKILLEEINSDERFSGTQKLASDRLAEINLALNLPVNQE